MSVFMNYCLLGAVVILAIYIFICMIRVVIGPTVADRIIAANMIGTLVIIIISLLAVYLNESGLLDVAMIYAMLSFIAVVVLTKIYLGVFIEKKNREKAKAEAAEASKPEAKNGGADGNS